MYNLIYGQWHNGKVVYQKELMNLYHNNHGKSDIYHQVKKKENMRPQQKCLPYIVRVLPVWWKLLWWAQSYSCVQLQCAMCINSSSVFRPRTVSCHSIDKLFQPIFCLWLIYKCNKIQTSSFFLLQIRLINTILQFISSSGLILVWEPKSLL